MQTIGERIKYLREKRGLSQHDLAALTGLQRGNISHYERNKVKPSAEAIVQLAAVFAVSSDWLLTGRILISSETGDPGVAERLQQLRLQRGLSEQELGQRSGVEADEVIDWEAGRLCPSVSMLARLATFFGVSLDWLVTGDGGSASSFVPSLDQAGQHELRLFTEFLQYRQQRVDPSPAGRAGPEMLVGELVKEAGGCYLPLFGLNAAESSIMPDAVWEGFVLVDGQPPGSRCFVFRAEADDLLGVGVGAGDLLVVQFLEPPAPGEQALVRVGMRTMLGRIQADGRVQVLDASDRGAPNQESPGRTPVLIGRIAHIIRQGISPTEKE